MRPRLYEQFSLKKGNAEKCIETNENIHRNLEDALDIRHSFRYGPGLNDYQPLWAEIRNGKYCIKRQLSQRKGFPLCNNRIFNNKLQREPEL